MVCLVAFQRDLSFPRQELGRIHTKFTFSIRDLTLIEAIIILYLIPSNFKKLSILMGGKMLKYREVIEG